MARNAVLNQELQAKDNLIQALSADNSILTTELNYCTRRGEVLVREKAARLEEEVRLRKGIREFTEQIQTSLQTYYRLTEIVDYLGSELIMRASTDLRKNVLLVDLSNPVRANGTIIGGRAWLTGPTRLHFCLLRQSNVNGKYTVISVTPEITTTQTGKENWIFGLPMAARKGDLIGVYIADTVTIPYDDVDTGDVVSFSGEVKINSSVTIVRKSSRNKRTYSFGVIGYFDNPVESSDESIPSSNPPASDSNE